MSTDENRENKENRENREHRDISGRCEYTAYGVSVLPSSSQPPLPYQAKRKITKEWTKDKNTQKRNTRVLKRDFAGPEWYKRGYLC